MQQLLLNTSGKFSACDLANPFQLIRDKRREREVIIVIARKLFSTSGNELLDDDFPLGMFLFEYLMTSAVSH